jgi:hypothetical protein
MYDYVIKACSYDFQDDDSVYIIVLVVPTVGDRAGIAQSV